jgi:predicted pyridoxine 5'-phosphate oxidase superfamily flavin-nucleotide-binding protein
MAAIVNDELKEIIADKNSIKVLASVDTVGNPHVVAKGSLTLSEDATQLVYQESLENSKTNKNLATAIRLSNRVAVNVISADRRSYQIKGKPAKAVTSGEVFEEYYNKAKERNPQSKLAAVYYIDIEEVINESYPVRLQEELDKLKKE